MKAQKTDWSEPQKIKDKIIYSEVIGAYQGNYYLIRYNKKSKQQFIIEKYDNKLKLAKKYELEAPKYISVEKILMLDGKIYIFTVSYNFELKKHELYVGILSDNLNVIEKDKLLLSSDFKYTNRKSFHISKDMFYKRILIIYPENTKDNNLIFRMSIFNPNLEKLFYSSFLIDSDRNYQIDQFQLVDSSIAVVYKTFKGTTDDPTDELYYMVYSDLKRNKQTLYKFFDDSIYFNNLLLRYDIPNRTMICAGYYSVKELVNLEGIAYLKIFTNKDSATFRTIPFSGEMKSSILGKYNKRDWISSFFPKAIIVRDDGGFIFIGEYYKIQKEFYNDYYTLNSTYVRYFYHYGNTMILSVNPDSKIDWEKVIRKEQVSMSDEGYYSSITTATSQNRVALLYNDVSRTRTNLIFNAIEPNSTLNNYIVVNGNLFNGTAVPKLGKQVNENEIIIPGFESKKGFSFVRVSF